MSHDDGPLDFAAIASNVQNSGLPIRKLMLPEILFAEAGADSEVTAERRAVVEVEDFRFHWPTSFSGERFTEL